MEKNNDNRTIEEMILSIADNTNPMYMFDLIINKVSKKTHQPPEEVLGFIMKVGLIKILRRHNSRLKKNKSKEYNPYLKLILTNEYNPFIQEELFKATNSNYILNLLENTEFLIKIKDNAGK